METSGAISALSLCLTSGKALVRSPGTDFVTAAKATPLDRLDLAASGFCCSPAGLRASLVAQVLRSLSAVQETQV